MSGETDHEARFDPASIVREMDKDGIGWHPRRARERHMAAPVIAFVRHDGWSLGASAGCEAIAFDSWRGTWAHFARQSEGWRLRPIEEYKGGVC